MRESDLKHGAVYETKASAKWQRARRPHIDRHVARASLPFDWREPVDNTAGVKIKNQYQSSSCGGQSGSYLLGIKFKQDVSAKSVYNRFVFPGGGMTVSGLERQICEYGANLEVAVPSYKPDGTTDESWMTDRSYLNTTFDMDALTRSGWSVVTVPRNAESIAQAIRDYGGVIWKITGKNNGTWLSSNPQVPDNWGDTWNHFLCCAGASLRDGEKTITALQSWGENVGLNGLQFFTDTYITSPYITDCFTFVRTDTLTQQKTKILTAMIAWLRMMLN